MSAEKLFDIFLITRAASYPFMYDQTYAHLMTDARLKIYLINLGDYFVTNKTIFLLFGTENGVSFKSMKTHSAEQ